jgi:proline iminopeptidase
MAVRLREVTVPALVIHGGNDDVTSEAGAEYFATDVLDGRSVTLDHSEHFPFLAEPNAFNETLREFLDEL